MTKKKTTAAKTGKAIKDDESCQGSKEARCQGGPERS
jgi:hypothetical protein